jgi:hypothetical protein
VILDFRSVLYHGTDRVSYAVSRFRIATANWVSGTFARCGLVVMLVRICLSAWVTASSANKVVFTYVDNHVSSYPEMLLECGIPHSVDGNSPD